MFLPRVQTKLIALVFIVVSLYFLTRQWPASSDLPSDFLAGITGKGKDLSSGLSSAPKHPDAQIDEKPLQSSSDLPQPEKTTPETPGSPSKPQAPTKSESPAKPNAPAKPDGSSDSKPKHEAPSQGPEHPEDPTTSAAAAAPTISPILNPGAIKSDVTPEARIEFWRKFEKLLADSDPKCPPPSRNGNAVPQGFDPNREFRREDFLSMPDKDVEKMKIAHKNLVEALNKQLPELPYTKGTRGIVTTAGGVYLPTFVISLRMLRRSGTSLPMEVFLADDTEYEKEICDDVLPTLNAKCIVLSKTIDAVPHKMQIKHYQFKVFALLFSSFEDVLFLDSDAFPIRDAEQLFLSEPFQSTGMVTWPDFWVPTHSHFYYDISAQDMPPVNLRQSTESGEILLAKATHAKSLLLATYYNYYKDHYYRLLSQGAIGEGDKETFIAAAGAVNESFYQTSEKVSPIGHIKQSTGIFTGTAMVQYDPIEDYRLISAGIWRVKAKNNKGDDLAKRPRPFFLHVNFPRPNPRDVFNQEEHTKAFDGSFQRTWTHGKSIMDGFDYDIEKDMWAEVRWVSCELEHSFKCFKGYSGMCENATRYYEDFYLHESKSNSEVKKEEPKKEEEKKKSTGFKIKPAEPGS